MLKKILGLTLVLVLALPGLAFAGAAGGSDNTTTYTNTTSTSTSHSTYTSTANEGNIFLGETINGYELDELHPDWGYNYYGYNGAHFNYTWSETRNYSSTLELLVQQPNSYSTSGNFWQATHPGEAFVSYGGRGSVLSESGPQLMGSSNYALSATAYDGTSAHNSEQVSSTSSSTSITVGDFTLGTNTNINTNTNTNTDYEADYTTYTGNGQYDYYEVNAVTSVSPIVLDLSHTGRIDASGGTWLPHRGLQGKVALFDIRGDGLDMLMEWVGPKAGLLVNVNHDGTLDGNSLFGTAGGYANGFDKLSLRDRNRDGKLTGAELNGLAVWVDANQNGKIDKGEIHSLASLGITELNLKHRNLKSSFVMHGKTEAMWDWWPTALDVRKVAVNTRK